MSVVLGQRVEGTTTTRRTDSHFPFEPRDPWERGEQLLGDAPPPLPRTHNKSPQTPPPRPSARVWAAHFDRRSCWSVSLNSSLLFFLFLFLLFSSRSLRLGGPVVVSRMGASLPLIFQTSVASRFSRLLMYGSVNKPAQMKMGISVVSGSLE